MSERSGERRRGQLGPQIGHVSLPTPSLPSLLILRSVPRPLSSLSSSRPTTSPAYYYLLLLRPSSSASYSSVSALKGITAIVATERGSGACHYAASAADSVTVLTSFARGVDPKVKSVTGARAVAAPLVMTLLWRRHTCERSARIMADRPTVLPPIQSSFLIAAPFSVWHSLVRTRWHFYGHFIAPFIHSGESGKPVCALPSVWRCFAPVSGLVVVPSLAPEEHCERERV